MSWKCRMEKSPPEVFAQLFQRLLEECIMRLVEEYRARTTAASTSKATDRKYFLYKRDALKDHKTKTVKQFLEWSEDAYGESTVRHMRDTGRLPYGVFVAYARAHKDLTRACVLSGPLCAPRIPTWHCKNNHLFQVRLPVACPSGTIGTHVAFAGAGRCTKRSSKPSGAMR